MERAVTRNEFETWIEVHYDELLAVACKRTNDQDEAEDALQAAIAGMLDSKPFMEAPIEYAWPRAVKFVTSLARHHRVSRRSIKRLRAEIQQINLSASRLLGRVQPKPTEDQR